MFESQGEIVVGYRWHTNQGNKACQQCAALDGKEFYFAPKPGQRPVDEMPSPPLHPNCRCSVEEILDYAKVMEQQDKGGSADDPEPADEPVEQKERLFDSHHISPRFHQGAKRAFGVNWCNDGRKVSDGPNYGNRGGQNWGGGMNTTGMSRKDMDRLEEKGQLLGPIDKMDEYFKVHDYCYFDIGSDEDRAASQFACDQQLVDQLKSLPDDPNHPEWGRHHKNEGEIDYARRLRAYASWCFEGKVNWYVVDQAEDSTKVE